MKLDITTYALQAGVVLMNLNSCFYHPNLPAVLVCYRCGRKICGSCTKSYNGLNLCSNCYHSVPAPTPTTPSAAVAPMPPVNASGMGGVRPAGWYGPYTHIPLLGRLWWLPAMLVGIAALLIIANGVALLSPSFYFYWSALLPWVAALGTFSFILGIVLGLVLFGAVIMMFLRFRIIAAFVILPTAIVSLFIGGGFFLGAILAVLTGILLLMMS
ncbi:MAG TPA: hypothetical protein VJZ03_07690 [Candidatus Bathyarchaeia archaeon]|nr:hypothetical protein [Candidatus Bathyarchaeia archaeon]